MLCLMDYLPQFHLALSAGILPLVSFGASFVVSPFQVILCVCFHISECSTLPACLRGVDFCGRSSVGLSGAVSLISCLDALGWPFLPFVWALLFAWALLVGGFSPPAGFLVVTTPTLSFMLLYRCWLTKQCYETANPMPTKRTSLPYQQSQPQLSKGQ